jgi:hypothetical protein
MVAIISLLSPHTLSSALESYGAIAGPNPAAPINNAAKHFVVAPIFIFMNLYYLNLSTCCHYIVSNIYEPCLDPNNINKDNLFCLVMVNVEFVEQLVDSMGDAVLQLEKAAVDKDKDKVNKLRVFVFDLHRQLAAGLEGKNV